jgi:hypothetical protein
VDPAVHALLRRRRPPLAGRILPALAETLAGAPPFVLVLDDAAGVGRNPVPDAAGPAHLQPVQVAVAQSVAAY